MKPKTERSVRFGYHWVVHRQLDRVGKAIQQNRRVGQHVQYLKNLCRPFWRNNEAFKTKWEELKRLVDQEMADYSDKERNQKLRHEQFNMLVDLLWDNDVMKDEGIPKENIEILEN